MTKFESYQCFRKSILLTYDRVEIDLVLQSGLKSRESILWLHFLFMYSKQSLSCKVFVNNMKIFYPIFLPSAPECNVDIITYPNKPFSHFYSNCWHRWHWFKRKVYPKPANLNTNIILTQINLLFIRLDFPHSNIVILDIYAVSWIWYYWICYG